MIMLDILLCHKFDCQVTRVLPNKRTWAKDGEEAHEKAKGFLKRWAPSSKYNNHRLLRLNDEKPLAEQN